MRHSSLLLLLLPALTAADGMGRMLTGHTKVRAVAEAYPDGSLFRDLSGPTALDIAADLRLNATAGYERWSLHAAYQLFGTHGDRTEFGRRLMPPATVLPDDGQRLFDLSNTFRDAGRSASGHRLDRLWAGYTSANAVVRIGRQALSWGNGLFFAPLDVVNPFDPSAIDTEYKTGDDMLYGQFLFANGNDAEAAWVLRRDPQTGRVDAARSTAAVRYNGLAENTEYQLLAGRSRGETILGIGGSRGLGGAVWRADLALSEAGGWTAQFVTNLGYSWRWFGRNVAGTIEYFFNGFGLPDGRYSAAAIAADADLAPRLARGELFTPGRHYLAGSLTIELTPLWQLQPNLLGNLDDGSALLQAVVQHSLGDNLAVLAALEVPVGPAGSEYGGLDSGTAGAPLTRDARVFAQLAWYF